MQKTAFKVFSNLKFALYFGEFYNLYLIRKYFGKKPIYKVTDSQKQVFFNEIQKLIAEDYEIFAQKILPYSCLKPEPLIQHFARFGRILVDNFFVTRRRNSNSTKSFSKKFDEVLEDLPEYYRRNFHFQTDGYLSEHSAKIYDHQVEMLFNGTGGQMRRMLLPVIKKYMKQKGNKPLKILEVACGTGSTTQFVAQAFPSSQITCLDISKAYLKQAQYRLQDFNNINYMQANAENLDFKDMSFDIVFSTYLFHELPLEVRKKIIQETQRVLKPDGLWLSIDSIQKQDSPQLQWAMDIFPKEYHEPFYKNYILYPLEKLLEKYGTPITKTGFLSKLVYLHKTN